VRKLIKFLPIFLIILLIIPQIGQAQALPKITIGFDKAAKPSDFNQTMQILFLITILSLAPSILIMMTSFTRILIVFHFVRTALGTQTVPANQILIGLSLFMTFFIMRPVINEMNEKALQPYLKNQIEQREAFQEASKPIKLFMLKQTRAKELELFHRLSNEKTVSTPEELSLGTVIPAFIISEIKTAFQIGFLIYLPMLLIDMIVASVLLSMGMMMLPPTVISMPLKILLFVLVDGWYLTVESLVKGFK
jgi:flagellar biosynthetic protein FliP